MNCGSLPDGKAAVPNRIDDALFRLALNALDGKADKPAVVSPFSIGVALAMVNVGAEGKTSQQISDAVFDGISKEVMTAWFRRILESLTMSIEKPANDIPEYLSKAYGGYFGNECDPLTMASALFFAKELQLKEPFKSSIMENFSATVDQLDFKQDPAAQVKKLNNFVEKATKGKIRNVFNVGVINEETTAVIVNAMHLKMNFRAQFRGENTRKENFHNEDATTKKVLMMHGTQRGHFFEDGLFAFASLPFAHGFDGFDFFFVVPKSGRLSDLKTKFCTSKRSFSSTIEAGERCEFIDVTIPKFKTEASFDLKAMLKNLGMTEVFSESRSDLSGMHFAVEGFPLYVRHIIQKALFEINELGVEAAAVTYVRLSGGGRMPDPKVIKADKPFLYGVTYCGVPLFVGQHY
ncbi:hypothetical protein QR680_008022 [Steinernema hermaphroditum]|uniref:Serpin domain-containing protein n=1 Tax=Steinernema hermaphroditum TaxID=289476 RepID=A0AA39M7C0_9BILA|nr:hypothetical protein QR680_008022 [Steinernema hermaphroditum]